MDEAQKLAAEYAEAGVELPALPTEAQPDVTKVEEIKPEPEKEPAPEPKPEDTKVVEDLSKTDTEPKKRSIYVDLKETRKEVKTERELREQAERERDELKAKLEGKVAPSTDDALDLDAFAKEIDADPNTLKRMREVFLKGLDVPKVDTAVLEKFEKWQAENSQAIEQQAFEREFQQALPTIKTLFPEVSTDELGLIKTKLDELAHTDQFHDKELDYVMFKNQEVIKSLVSPKKKGIESKGRVDATAPVFDFDPNADITKMSDKEMAAWEQAYKAASKQDNLTVDGQGKRIFI